VALPGVAYPGVRDNRSTINTKTGYDDDDDVCVVCAREKEEQLKGWCLSFYELGLYDGFL